MRTPAPVFAPPAGLSSVGSSLAALSVAAVAFAALTLSPHARADELVVGANVGNVPWQFQDDGGDIVGFEIDLVNAVADELGHTVTVENIPFNGLFSAVQSGRIDIATSSITITDERLESVSFAQPYYDSDQSLTARSDSGIASLDDLDGKVIGVDTGSTGDMWASDNAEEYGFGEIRRYEGLSPAMLDLAAGRIDGYISDIPALLYYTKDKPELDVVQRIETGEKYSMMFAKDAELAAEVNEALTTLKESGTVAELHEKWFGSAPEASTSTVTVLDMPSTK